MMVDHSLHQNQETTPSTDHHCAAFCLMYVQVQGCVTRIMHKLTASLSTYIFQFCNLFSA